MILPERNTKLALRRPEMALPEAWAAFAQAILDTFDEGHLIAAGPEGRVVAANEEAARLVGYPGELVGASLAEVLGAAWLSNGPLPTEPFAVALRGQNLHLRCTRLSSGGPDLWMIRIGAGRSSCSAETGSDAAAAQRDPLTGLATRAALLERIRRVQSRPAPAGETSALLFGDLDRFKPVNDRHGHLAGDFVLCEVARRLSACLRPGDFVCRYGGDEFAAIVTGLSSHADAEVIARRIAAEIARPMEIGRASGEVAGWVCVTMSLGIAPVEAGDDPLEPIRQADQAMYRAKFALSRVG